MWRTGKLNSPCDLYLPFLSVNLPKPVNLDCVAGEDLLYDAPWSATWRSGYAPDCKSVYPGSIPGVASKFSYIFVFLNDAHDASCGFVSHVTFRTDAERPKGQASPD